MLTRTHASNTGTHPGSRVVCCAPMWPWGNGTSSYSVWTTQPLKLVTQPIFARLQQMHKCNYRINPPLFNSAVLKLGHFFQTFGHIYWAWSSGSALKLIVTSSFIHSSQSLDQSSICDYQLTYPLTHIMQVCSTAIGMIWGLLEPESYFLFIGILWQLFVSTV